MDKKDHPFKNTRTMPLGLKAMFAGMRVLFNVLDRLSPKLAGRLALRLFMTPPGHRMPKREKPLNDAATLYYYTIRDRDIAVRSWGEGPMVMLTHGWGGRTTQLHAFVQPLVDAGYRVVGFDIPAHGDSGGKQTSMLDAAKLLDEIITLEQTQNQAELKAIISHSFGTGVTLLAMDRYHLKPDKLVLISGFADANWICRIFGELFDLSDRVIAAMQQSALDLVNDEYGPWSWEDISPQHTIKSVRADLLLIHDEQDHEVPFEQAQVLRQAAPQAQTLTTSGYGHRKILMNHDCVSSVVDFVTGQAATRA